MATFKVGQRVRIVINYGGPVGNLVVGREGVITGRVDWQQGRLWVVKVPGTCVPGDSPLAPDEWACRNDELEPLTDPGADACWDSISIQDLILKLSEHLAQVPPDQREKDIISGEEGGGISINYSRMETEQEAAEREARVARYAVEREERERAEFERLKTKFGG